MLAAMDLRRFESLAAAGATVVPVWREIVADDLTPVSAFGALQKRGTPGSDQGFLLESVVGGEKWARYSFVGFDPALVVRGGGSRFVVDRRGALTTTDGVDPFESLRALMAEFKPPPADALRELPRFWGGAVGFFAYDAVRRFEPKVRPPTTDAEDEFSFLVGRSVLIFDALRQSVRVVVPTLVGEDPGTASRASHEIIDRTVETLRGRARLSPIALPSRDRVGTLPPSSFERDDFEAAVRTCQGHILAGDIFQVVLAQRFELEADVDPFDVYRAMRVVNPSPYMFFLRVRGATSIDIAGASPETLVRVEDGIATVRPIAGTRPRGATEAEDEQHAADLLVDPKERAEHVMLVDLGRNDLGRISEPGSVKLTEEMIIERYSHVMHMTSNVIGKVADGRDALDVLRATFPAGTLSGAPKVRAMQIIEALEPVRRGIYGGAVGYLGFDGNADLAIAIRTVVAKGGRLTLQAGAGIVADSDPATEYEETLNKARGLLKAIEITERRTTS